MQLGATLLGKQPRICVTGQTKIIVKGKLNNMDTPRPIKRALLSVSDKTGIVEFAQKLAQKGVDILSTGGTAKLLAENGIKVTEVSDYTGHPEIMDGRVKTLHPKV